MTRLREVALGGPGAQVAGGAVLLRQFEAYPDTAHPRLGLAAILSSLLLLLPLVAVAGVPLAVPVWAWAAVLGGLALLPALAQVTQEQVMLAAGVGVQMTAWRRCGLVARRVFLPEDSIGDVVITEVVHRVIFDLVVLPAAATGSVVPLFTCLRPRLGDLRTVYQAAQQCFALPRPPAAEAD